jgi:hypothetical protein
VVIAIIAILAAMLLPVLARAKSKGYCVSCLNNLHQLQICWNLYGDDHNGLIPKNDAVPSASLMNAWILGNAKTDTTCSNIETGVLFPYNLGIGIDIVRPTAQPSSEPRSRASGVIRCATGSTATIFGFLMS